MRSIVLLSTLLLPALAVAQTARPGTTTSGAAPAHQTPTTTAAPVPEVAPGVPATGGAAAVPEQIAPPGLDSGPANATPLSSTPSGNLPPDQSLPFNRDRTGGAGSATPNLSR